MSKRAWDDKAVFYLIDKVQKAEYMWNFTHMCYKNKLKKSKFWVKVVDDMNRELNPHTPFTSDELLRKWNNLKSYFTAENQKLYKAQKSAAAAADEEETIGNSWKFKSRMDFLLTIIDSTNSSTACSENNRLSNLSEFFSENTYQASNDSTLPLNEFIKLEERSPTSTPNSVENENSFEGVTCSSNEISVGTTENLSDTVQAPKSIVSTHVKKKLRIDETSPNELLAVMLLEASKDLRHTLTQKKETYVTKTTIGNSTFGACISTEIDKLTPDLQISAKKQIFSIIMDLQAEQLKRNQN